MLLSSRGILQMKVSFIAYFTYVFNIYFANYPIVSIYWGVICEGGGVNIIVNCNNYWKDYTWSNLQQEKWTRKCPSQVENNCVYVKELRETLMYRKSENVNELR
jgi:hypothetical protein